MIPEEGQGEAGEAGAAGEGVGGESGEAGEARAEGAAECRRLWLVTPGENIHQTSPTPRE